MRGLKIMLIGISLDITTMFNDLKGIAHTHDYIVGIIGIILILVGIFIE